MVGSEQVSRRRLSEQLQGSHLGAAVMFGHSLAPSSLSIAWQAAAHRRAASGRGLALPVSQRDRVATSTPSTRANSPTLSPAR